MVGKKWPFERANTLCTSLQRHQLQEHMDLHTPPTGACTYTRTHIHAHTCIRACTCVHAHTRTHVCLHTHTFLTLGSLTSSTVRSPWEAEKRDACLSELPGRVGDSSHPLDRLQGCWFEPSSISPQAASPVSLQQQHPPHAPPREEGVTGSSAQPWPRASRRTVSSCAVL